MFLSIARRQKSRRDYMWVETLRFSISLTSAPWGAQKIGLLDELPTYNPYGISPFGVGKTLNIYAPLVDCIHLVTNKFATLL